MNLLRKYKVILIIVVPIVILVFFRSSGTYHFRADARKLAEPSFSKSNIITPASLPQLVGDKLFVTLGKGPDGFTAGSGTIMTIPPDSILLKENLRMLRNHTGPVLLYSTETAISVRLWMILSQMGFKHLYVFSNDPYPEVLKYEFRPDTMVRPEL